MEKRKETMILKCSINGYGSQVPYKLLTKNQSKIQFFNNKRLLSDGKNGQETTVNILKENKLMGEGRVVLSCWQANLASCLDTPDRMLSSCLIHSVF